MKYSFKVKRIDITTGGKNIVIMNRHAAKELDLVHLDRVNVFFEKKQLCAVVDLTDSFVKKDEVGIFSEPAALLGVRQGQSVFLEPTDKPFSVGLIKKKMDGGRLEPGEIGQIVHDVMAENLSDVELTALITAMYIQGLDHTEILSLTRSIIESGDVLDWKTRPVMDKHCVGGIPGNRTTMLIVPIVAAAGLLVPKTSSRSITSPAGTADTMEVLAPVSLSKTQILNAVGKTNACIAWGGGLNLAAADDKLIKIRHPLNLDPRGVMIASILSKKKAAGSTHVLIDLPIGRGAKIFSREEAQAYANDFMDLGSKLGMEIECIITPGYDPVGFAVGPALEAREVMRILEGQQVSPDLIEKSVTMAGLMLEMGGAAEKEQGRAAAVKILESGKALEKMREIIAAQGGNASVKSDDIQVGKKTFDVVAKESGRIYFVNIRNISAIARAAGAPAIKQAGVYLFVEKGDKVKAGDKLLTIFADSQQKLAAAKELVERKPPVEMEKIILGEYSMEHKKPFEL